MSRLQPLPGLNAFRLDFDPELLAPIQTSYSRELAPFFADPAHRYLLAGGKYHQLPVGAGHYYLVSYDTDPLLWLSNHNAATFALFEDFFKALQIGDELRHSLDCARQVALYCGFLVVGDRCDEALWHYDYRPGALAYTLLTPLFELAPGHGHLLYHDAQGQSRRHAYRLGEALLVGAGFMHCTEPYPECARIRVLLSLTFGSDRWPHWPLIRENVQEQSTYYRQPCGHAQGSCRCHARYLLGRKIKAFLSP